MGILKKNNPGIYAGRNRTALVEAFQTGEGWEVKRLLGSGQSVEAGQIKDLLGSSGLRSGRASISIPDALVKAAILEFDELPGKDEAAGIIKLKAAGILNASPSESTVGYHVLSSGKQAKVFALLAKKQIMEDYEESISSAGFEVGRISPHSLNLLNLYSKELPGSGAFSVIFKIEGSLTVIAVKDGVLDFYRNRIIEGDGTAREINSSLLAYRGKNPEAQIRKAFVFDDTGGLNEIVRNLGMEAEAVSPKIKSGVSLDGVNPLYISAAIGSAS